MKPKPLCESTNRRIGRATEQSTALPDLEAKLVELSKLKRTMERSTIVNRYRFASALAKLLGTRETYGKISVELIANRLGMGSRLLYQFIEVGKTISRDELREMVGIVDAHGYGLTWSHLRSLAAIDDRKARSALVNRWREESIDSTAFAKLVRSMRRPMAANALNEVTPSFVKAPDMTNLTELKPPVPQSGRRRKHGMPGSAEFIRHMTTSKALKS